jgi:hypothetical protein
MGGDSASAIYGTLTVGALLAAEQASLETYARTIIAIFITMMVYWLAHSYASSVQQRLRNAQALTFKMVGRTMLRESTILLGAAVPLLVVLVFGAAGAELTTAVNAGVWSSAIVIVGIETISAARADLKGTELVMQVVIGVLISGLVLVLRAVLH